MWGSVLYSEIDLLKEEVKSIYSQLEELKRSLTSVANWSSIEAATSCQCPNHIIGRRRTDERDDGCTLVSVSSRSDQQSAREGHAPEIVERVVGPLVDGFLADGYGLLRDGGYGKGSGSTNLVDSVNVMTKRNHVSISEELGFNQMEVNGLMRCGQPNGRVYKGPHTIP